MACSGKSQRPSMERNRCRDSGIKRIFCKSLRDLCAVNRDVRTHKNILKADEIHSRNDITVDRLKTEGISPGNSSNVGSDVPKEGLVDVNANILVTRQKRESKDQKDRKPGQHVQVDENFNTLSTGSSERKEDNQSRSNRDMAHVKIGSISGRFRGRVRRGIRGSSRYRYQRSESYGINSKSQNHSTTNSCDAIGSNKSVATGDGRNNETKVLESSEKSSREHFHDLKESLVSKEEIIVDDTGDHNQENTDGYVLQSSSKKDSVFKKGQEGEQNIGQLEMNANCEKGEMGRELQRSLTDSTCIRRGFGTPKKQSSGTDDQRNNTTKAIESSEKSSQKHSQEFKESGPSKEDILVDNAADHTQENSDENFLGSSSNKDSIFQRRGEDEKKSGVLGLKANCEKEEKDREVQRSLTISTKASTCNRRGFGTPKKKSSGTDDGAFESPEKSRQEHSHDFRESQASEGEIITCDHESMLGSSSIKDIIFQSGEDGKENDTLEFKEKGELEEDKVVKELHSNLIVSAKVSTCNRGGFGKPIKPSAGTDDRQYQRTLESSSVKCQASKESNFQRREDDEKGKGVIDLKTNCEVEKEDIDLEERSFIVSSKVLTCNRKGFGKPKSQNCAKSEEDADITIKADDQLEEDRNKSAAHKEINPKFTVNAQTNQLPKYFEPCDIHSKKPFVDPEDFEGKLLVESEEQKKNSSEDHIEGKISVCVMEENDKGFVKHNRITQKKVHEERQRHGYTVPPRFLRKQASSKCDGKETYRKTNENWSEEIMERKEEKTKEIGGHSEVNSLQTDTLKLKESSEHSPCFDNSNFTHKRGPFHSIRRGLGFGHPPRKSARGDSVIEHSDDVEKTVSVLKEKSRVLPSAEDWEAETLVVGVEEPSIEKVVVDVQLEESAIVCVEVPADVKESEVVEDLPVNCANEETCEQLDGVSTELVNTMEDEESQDDVLVDVKLQDMSKGVDVALGQDVCHSKFLWERKLEILTSICEDNEIETPAVDKDVEEENAEPVEVVVEKPFGNDVTNVTEEKCIEESSVNVCSEETKIHISKEVCSKEGIQSNSSDENQNSEGFSVKNFQLDEDVYQLDNSDGFCEGSTSVSDKKDLIRSNIDDERSVGNERDYVSKSSYDELIEERISCLESETKPKVLKALDQEDSADESPLKRYLKCVNRYQEKNGKGSHSELLAKYGRSAKDVYRKFELNDAEQCEELERELLSLLSMLERDLQSEEENEMPESTETAGREAECEDGNVCAVVMEGEKNDQEFALSALENISTEVACSEKTIHSVPNFEKLEHFSEESDVFSVNEGNNDGIQDDRSEGTLGEVSTISEDDSNNCTEDAEVSKMKILSAVTEFQRKAQEAEESSESEQMEVHVNPNHRIRRHSSSRRVSTTIQEPEETVLKTVHLADKSSLPVMNSVPHIEIQKDGVSVNHKRHNIPPVQHSHQVKEVNNNLLDVGTCSCSKDSVFYWMWRSCPCSELLLLDVWSGQGYDDSCAFAEPEKIPMDTLKSFRAPHEQCSPSARSSHRASHLQRGVKDRKRSDRSQRRESITTNGDINDHNSIMDPHWTLSPEAVKDCLGRGRGSLLNQFPHQNQPPPPGFDSTTKKRVPVPRPKLPDHRLLPCNPSHSSEKPFPLERKFPHGLIIPQKVQTKQFDINTNDQGDQYAVPTGHSMSSQFTPPVRSLTSPDSTRGRGILRMPHFNRPGHMTSASSCRHMSPYKFNPGHSNREFENVQHDLDMFEERTSLLSHEPLKSSKGMTRKRCVLGANNQIKKSCENMDIARKATSDRPMSYVERLQLEEEIIRKTNLSAYGAENLEKCKNLKNARDVANCDATSHLSHFEKINELEEEDLSVNPLCDGENEIRRTSVKPKLISCKNDPNNNVVLDYKEEHSVTSSANNDANSSSAVTPKKKTVYFEDTVPKIPVYVPPHRRQPITKKPSTLQDTSVKCSVGSAGRKSANFVQSLAPGSYMRAKYEKKKELDQQEVDSDESCDNVSIASQDEVQNEELEDVEDKRYPNTPYAYQNYLRLWENMVPYEYNPFVVPPPPYAFAYGVYPPWPSPRPFWEMMESSPPQTVPDVSKTVKEESLARFEPKVVEVEEAEETSETIGEDTCSDFSPMGRWPPKFLSRSKLIDTDSDSLCSYGLDWKSHFLEKCHSYEEPYIDSHCHIDLLFSRLGYRGTWSDYRLQNQDTIPANFQGCVAVFCNPGSFKREGLWTSVAEEENVWLTFGCHPKNATEFTARAEEGLRKCLTNDKVVALGEIGLDYSGMFYQYAVVQKQVLRRQLQIALEMSLPLVIHCREAEDDCLEILEEMVPRNYKIHCHCFTGNFKSALRWLHLFPNIYLGLTPVVTYKTATGPHEVARFLPLERLLLETDSPYFLPKKIPRGDLAYSHPGMAIVVAEEVARIKNIAVRDVLKACRQNTLDMYGV